MDYDQDELSRESSEPCLSRPNPFDDDPESSRKRQRVSRGGSRSRSVDTARASDLSDRLPPQEATTATPTDLTSSPPTTPPNRAVHNLPSEPTSSRVTINLRTTKSLDQTISSPPSPSSPSRMVDGAEEIRTGLSTESSDALSTLNESPSSSPSVVESPPRVELVVTEDEHDFRNHSPPVAIIGEDDVYDNPMQSFPFLTVEDNNIISITKRLINFIQYDAIEDESCFVKLVDWIDLVLAHTEDNPDAWHECYTDHREFWQYFPELIWAFQYRSKHFGSFMRSSLDGRRALSSFFVHFARLAGRFVAFDVRTLSLFHKTDDENELELASRGYVAAYSYLLRKNEKPHIGNNLEVHYSWDWDDDVAAMIGGFQSTGGSLANLTKLVQGQVKFISRNPKTTVECLVEACQVARSIAEDIVGMRDGQVLFNRALNEGAQQKVVRAYDFFKVMSVSLELIIEKYITFLSPEFANRYMDCLSMILRLTLSSENAATRDVLERRRLELPHLDGVLPKLLTYEWKFNIFNKFITSTQMQLRVVGVTRMSNDLVDIHRNYNNAEVTPTPFLLFFANFILKHKLVDYLVGAGSHPEIISESYNIVGFLIVTRTYAQEESDKIWQTVLVSQDPRVVEAILRTLSRNLMGLYQYDSVLYHCQKMMLLPIENFTAAARECCESIVREIMRKSIHDRSGAQYVAYPPYELCVQLIRQSSIITAECPSGYPDIYNFAASRLRELLPLGPSAAVRDRIYLECIEDITARTPTALGSICVINALLRQNIGDLHDLATSHGLTRLVIEDLQATTLQERLLSKPLMRNSPASQARRDLLLAIILKEPSTISPELGTQLWDLLVGRETRSSSDRNVSWQTLNSAVKQSGPNNVFIASCFRDHLPNLPPDCFTLGALEFAREATLIWLDEAYTDFVEKDKHFESPALQQLWRMIVSAPPNTIDATAINMLVEIYLESQLITSLPRVKALSIHLALVNRCLNELAVAATKLKVLGGGGSKPAAGAMEVVTSDVEISEQNQIFARSLAVLREFLKAYQLKPHFAIPKVRKLTKLPSSSAQCPVEGEALILKFQSFDGDTQTEVQSLTLGKLNNAATLFAKIEKATGFTSYKIYCDGKAYDPGETEVSKSMAELDLKGLVLVHRREDAEGGIAQGNKPSLEAEITKHFDDLWGYLAMHEQVAQEIYYFLVKFPVYERLTLELASDSISYSEIFPPGQPFKSLYAIHALREFVNDHSSKGSLSDEFLTRAVSLITAAISDPEVIGRCPGAELRDSLVLHFIDCFVNLLNLKGLVSGSSSTVILSKTPEIALPAAALPSLNEALLQRLLEILQGAKSSATATNSIHLTGQSFEAILDACIHNPQLWTIFKTHLNGTDLLCDLLLNDPRLALRKGVVKQIVKKCAFGSSSAKVSATEFTVAFWPMVLDLIPRAVKQPQKCDETFMLCQQLLKKLADTEIESVDLEGLIRQWSTLLLSHTPDESIGHPENIDLVASGLANLLYWAASYAKGSQRSLSVGTVGIDLLREHLFPELSLEGIDKPRSPLLNTNTRNLITETIFLLVKDDVEQYKEILLRLSTLVPYDTQCEVPYAFNPLLFLHDRSKAIRSSTGYVGLKNLSNTCYLNSLFTQLFMNVPFREFMLDSNTPETASQKLLHETKDLFSHMQNSVQRFVDPAKLASSIRTYEETAIDVSVQMDVDEFYNLLFDRWESQILVPEAKKKFRSFYGGQLVQQVKSKECSHISERLEPFSAIQCDIKGKSSLAESLQAYVDGEIMEGDNKYKCSTCDRHVDAVKRACLKDIPDDLIFHLKRFDFNLRTLTRSKINDYFSFPAKIDMRPYKVEYLTNGAEDSPEDVFELVGVLVHSGTAESGHYYSYIRERPSATSKENWVEFNDDNVQNWDPNYMESSCFGGVDYRGTIDHANVHYDKTYSAYMLFYQRSSVLARQRQRMELEKIQSPIRLPIPTGLFQHIAQDNEIIMRKYCLYDRSHVNFVTKMLGNIRHINKGTCSQEHHLEKIALTTALHHLDQVIARTKDLPDFSTFMLTLEQLCYSCAECSRDFLEWLCDFPETLRQQLLRNPDQLVRSRIARLILSALNKVRADASYAYGLGDDDGSDDGVQDDTNAPNLLQRVVAGIESLWDIFERHSRAWPEYFGLLVGIANMGEPESALLLDAGFLRRTLEIISADRQLPMASQYDRMLNNINKRIATRPVSYDSVIELMYLLLQLCDVGVEPVSNDEKRLELSLNALVIPFSNAERHLLTQHWTRSGAHILSEKLLYINQNPQATRNILIILMHWPDKLDSTVCNAISVGIRKGSSLVTASSFFQAAILYCEHSEVPRAIPNMVTHVARAVLEPENRDSKEFLHFFKTIYGLESNQSDMPKDEIEKVILDKAHSWAPALLLSFETMIRQETEEFLNDIILQHPTVIEFGLSDAQAAKGKTIIMAAQRLGIGCLEILQETFIRQRQQAVRSNLINIQTVIDTCTKFFDEEMQDSHSLTRNFFQLKTSVLSNVKRVIVEEIEEEISDDVWENSEEEGYGSSEPMDSIAEHDLDTDVPL